MAKRTDEAKRAQALALFKDEPQLSCRAIAERVGTSASTVSRWAKQAGHSFVRRAHTVHASAVASFDAAATRARLAEKMSKNAEKALDSLDGPFVVYNFGGSENTYSEHELDEAPISARRETQTLAGIAFDKLTKLTEKEPDAAVTDGVTLLQSIQVQLAATPDLYVPVEEQEAPERPPPRTAARSRAPEPSPVASGGAATSAASTGRPNTSAPSTTRTVIGG